MCFCYIVVHGYQHTFFLTVVKPLKTDSCNPSVSALLPLPVGYISSSSVQENGDGSIRCPWKIQAMPGQRVNVTLINFNSINGDPTNKPLG